MHVLNVEIDSAVGEGTTVTISTGSAPVSVRAGRDSGLDAR
jgi:hypothetical protein